MKPRTLLWILLGALLAVRLLFIGCAEMTPDEAYYTMWSERPDVSYYSKGPGVAMTIWLGTHLFGQNEFGVRFFSPLLALGTSLLMYALARRLYNETVAFWTVLTLQVIPIFQVGGLLMTIDPLSLFFWTAALLTCWRAVEESPGFSGWWPATGALIGLGFLCKWVNAFQLLSIILLLACTRRYRKELWRPGFWSMLGVFLLFLLPPVLWNMRHAWITVDHLTARGGLQKAMKINFGEFFQFLGAHFAVYSPLIFAAMLVALVWGVRRAKSQFKPRFLMLFAAPGLLLYFGLSLRQAGEANWTAPALLSLAPLAVAYWYELAQQQVWARRAAVAALIVGLIFSVLALDVDAFRDFGVKWPYERDHTARIKGWKTFAAEAGKVRDAFEAKQGSSVFLIGDRYQTAAILNFYLRPKRVEAPGHPVAYIPESQAIENQFSFWSRYDELTSLEQLGEDLLKQPGGAIEQQTAVREALKTLEQAELEHAQMEEKLQDTQLVDADSSLLEAVETSNAKRAGAKRALAHLLHEALPQLPIDESFVEEQGVSLFAGRTALYVTDRDEDRPASSIEDGFERWEMIACLDLRRHGQLLRQLRVFACYNYKGRSL